MGLGHYSLRARPLARCPCCPCWRGEHSAVRAPRARPRVPRACGCSCNLNATRKIKNFIQLFWLRSVVCSAPVEEDHHRSLPSKMKPPASSSSKHFALFCISE